MLNTVKHINIDIDGTGTSYFLIQVLHLY